MSLAKIGKRLLLRHTLVVISIMLSLFLVRTAQAAVLIDDMESLGNWTAPGWCINPVPALCDTEVKQGTYSLCMSFVNDQDGVYDGAGTYYNFSANPIDTTGYDLLRFWFKTTAAAPDGRTMIYLSDINGKSVMLSLECLYSSLQPNQWYEIIWPFKTLSTFRDGVFGAPITMDFTQVSQIFVFTEDQRYTSSTNVSLYFDDMKFMSSEEFLIDKDDNTGTDTGKKLICFADGGPTMGTPFTEVVRTNIATMEAQFPAVNGLVLQPSTDGTGWDAFMTHFWSNETMLPSVADPSLDDLANTSFSQYTDNFMRINCTPPGYADYFDDAAWTALLDKTAIAAKICHDGGLKGIFFDSEAYGGAGWGNPWSYASQANAALYTYEEYAVKTRQRGGEFMEALRSEYPDITILIPWTHYSSVVSGVALNVIPPRLDVYGSLYGPFIDGMLDECGDANFVDACECGYACKTYADFLMWKIIVKYIAPYSSVVPDIYRAKVKLGYGLWFGDGTCNTAQNWIDYASSANPFGAISPEQLSNMIYYAKWIGDSGYTWLYRNPVWNSTIGSYIPQAYLDAIADPHPPYLYTSLTSPENDDVFVPPSGITLEATASDTESAVSKVEFFYDGTNKIGEDTTSPYSCLWNSPAVGTHVLTSVATDSRGFKRTSGAVSITVWNTGDIGNATNGSASYSSGTYTVTGNGTGITGTADAFRFVYLPITGDCTIIARLVTFSGDNGNARAGVMIRDNIATDTGAKETTSGYHPTSPTGVSSHFRLTTGGTTSIYTAGYSSPYWLKVVRDGNNLTAWRSTNNITWYKLSDQTITMTDPVQVGLVVTSGNVNTKTATFSNVSITQP